jgi:cytochrome c oxidase cbb3-type subunit 3
MTEDEKKEVILDHDYDGIQEYDNPLPNWWLMTFFGTIIFAFLYYTHYEISGVQKTQLQELANDLKSSKAAEPACAEFTEESLEQKLNAMAADTGKQVFTEKCSVCHGPKGEGLIGPNLTDHFWIHGKGTRLDIYSTVTKGVLDKGMPSWETMLKPEELLAAVKYVYGLRGSNPPNPKAPQGVEYK